MDLYAQLISLFFVGFAVGVLACFLIMAQIYKHKRVKDELLKSKRAAIKAQRTLDRFLKTSLDLFGELDSAHKQYVDFLNEAAQKIAPLESASHSFLNQELNSEKKIKKQPSKHEPVNGQLGEITPPNVLKSPEPPQDGVILEDLHEAQAQTDDGINENKDPAPQLKV